MRAIHVSNFNLLHRRLLIYLPALPLSSLPRCTSSSRVGRDKSGPCKALNALQTTHIRSFITHSEAR